MNQEQARIILSTISPGVAITKDQVDLMEAVGIDVLHTNLTFPGAAELIIKEIQSKIDTLPLDEENILNSTNTVTIEDIKRAVDMLRKNNVSSTVVGDIEFRIVDKEK